MLRGKLEKAILTAHLVLIVFNLFDAVHRCSVDLPSEVMSDYMILLAKPYRETKSMPMSDALSTV